MIATSPDESPESIQAKIGMMHQAMHTRPARTDQYWESMIPSIEAQQAYIDAARRHLDVALARKDQRPMPLSAPQ